MVEIRIYGKLRCYAPDIQTDSEGGIRLSPEPNETLEALLKRLNIPVEKIYSIFLNSKLLAARSGMASMVGYPQVRGNPYNWDLNIALKLQTVSACLDGIWRRWLFKVVLRKLVPKP